MTFCPKNIFFKKLSLTHHHNQHLGKLCKLTAKTEALNEELTNLIEQAILGQMSTLPDQVQ